jgi:hypothetical protein
MCVISVWEGKYVEFVPVVPFSDANANVRKVWKCRSKAA